ncbi:hypothetical protein DSO57_1008562 [Entomophthora muscae]|uniref:Uncharacterized protein n=1 Tax=Entomophthora muscae TaxID=34485 RepID=A0ACC2UTF0_9FUNG|nr:hypothetical protein DSO57_1008562 [Entomophthora muscae]
MSFVYYLSRIKSPNKDKFIHICVGFNNLQAFSCPFCQKDFHILYSRKLRFPAVSSWMSSPGAKHNRDPYKAGNRMMIYVIKKSLIVPEKKDLGLYGTISASYPKIFNQLWAIQERVEERYMPPIYHLTTRTKQESYICALKTIKTEIHKIF